MNYIGVGILLWNVVVFLIFWADKRRSKNGQWRIPEKTLLLCSFLLGGVGGLMGMLVLRHKTRHMKFRILLPLAAVVSLAATFWLLGVPTL